MEETTYKKMEIKDTESFSYLDKLLEPVKDYVEEKKTNEMYDDYNEYTNTIDWMEKRKNAILSGEDVLTAYYIENNQKKVIGILFSLTGKVSISEFLKKHNLEVQNQNPCQLVCFHINKNYRGIGKIFLKDYVLQDLKEKGIDTVFIKSSHNRALSLYEKLGDKVGNYIGLSENQLYQRYGYIYQVVLPLEKNQT